MKKRKAPEPARCSKKRRLIAGCQVITPEKAGLSRAPLDRLRSVVHEEVHELGSLNGVAHVILKDGKCVFTHAAGMADIERGTKFSLNTICALHSCSKPLTVAAFLTLVDAGKVSLSDPISKYVSFSGVVASGQGKVRMVKTQPTLRHLLTQVAGLRGGASLRDESAYAKLTRQLKQHKIADLASFCDALAEIPLQSEPGAKHYYSLCIDVLGRVCEVVSSQTLDVFMKRVLFQPLGMVDTHFVVPRAKLRRKAALYQCKRVHGSKKQTGRKPYRAHRWSGPQVHLGLMSGGGGMLSYSDAGIYSTAEDYARFCQMLLTGGVAESGKRVLSRKTVSMLWQDCLTPFAKKNGEVPGWNDFEGKKGKFYWDHHAWSMLNATLDLEEVPKRSGPPRRGHTLWMYGMGAYWFVDAKRKMVAISMTQCFSGRWEDRGSDCVPFMKEAIDEGPAGAKYKKERFYYGMNGEPSKK
eukprot:TRINITY_DN31355_c0_g1_i1.p1 TRINITY_DN31355_c0_g1~~TRINITY_DN31355_c0_g1_i1.p1  ORF type:complete len:468 (-),score=82.41 TRINITY_DN31355_c0_g1_i1:219-1622(-)